MKERPQIVRGKTYRVETGSGDLYTTCNDDEDGSLFEVFVTIGKSGGFVASFTEAIGRLISLCLRCGVQSDLIAKQLIGIRGPRWTMHEGKQVYSVPDAIGRVILKHTGKTLTDIENVEEDPSKDEGPSVVMDDETNGTP